MALSKQIGSVSTQVAADFWPRPLQHCSRPLVTENDDEITIGEVTSQPVVGFAGNRMLYTAMVPHEEVASVLRAPSGIGHGVSSDARHPALGIEQSYAPPFWVAGLGSQLFESLIHTWLNHNRRILLPDSALLMCYGLIPPIWEQSVPRTGRRKKNDDRNLGGINEHHRHYSRFSRLGRQGRTT
jgi:hypothetical protein